MTFIALARGEAQRLRCPFVGTPHLLLALLQEEPERRSPGAAPYSSDLYAAVRTLRELGVDVPRLRREVERLSALDCEGWARADDPPLSARATLVLELAAREAAREDAPALTSVHLLTALLDDEGGAIAEALAASGVNAGVVRGLVRAR